MSLPLRRAVSAAASLRFRRVISTAASHPPWAMIRHAFPDRSPARAPRAWNHLVEPPDTSYLFVPAHLIDPRPAPDPDSDIMGTLGGLITASSGDGLLLITYQDGRYTAPVDAMKSGAAPVRKVTKFHMDADMTRFVCNPISGELFRLPDLDGTKKTMLLCHNMGLLTRSAAGHGPPPPDGYAAASLANGEGRTFVMRRFLSQTGEWEKLAGLPSPLPHARQMDIYPEVVAFAGRLWWVDLTWGAISADPFSDWPDLRFVELPRGSVRPGPNEDFVQAQGLFRRLGVSEGRLRYVEVSQKDPFLLSSFTLDDEGTCWTLEHRVALGRLLGDELDHPTQGNPRIAVIDPLDASVLYVIIGKDVLGVDMDMGKVLKRSLVDESEGPPWIITSVLKPCVLPQGFGSCSIPSAVASVEIVGSDTFSLADVVCYIEVGTVLTVPVTDNAELKESTHSLRDTYLQ